MNIHMDIHIWVPRDPWGGSMDTLGGPMGPWDRWDLGTDGTWASRTPDTSSEDTSSELFIDTRPGRPGDGSQTAARMLGTAAILQRECPGQQPN